MKSTIQIPLALPQVASGTVLAEARKAFIAGSTSAAVAVRSAELRSLSGIATSIRRSAEASAALSAASSVARSVELGSLSGIAASIRRSAEASAALSAASSVARSAELRSLSGIAASIRRSAEASAALSAASSAARSPELRHHAAVARRARLAEINLRPAITASRALAESTESQRLAAIARRAQLAEIAHVSRIARTAFSANFNLRQDIVPVHPFARSRELSKSAILADSIAHMRNADPESIASDDTNVGNFVFRTEFSLSVELAPIPQVIGSTDSCATFDPKHWFLLTQLEQRLRLLVEQKLEELAGPKWIKRRTSEAVRERWFRRQSDDRDSGRSVYPTIQYADFMDLADVIVQKNNWRDAFHQIFPDKAEIEVSLHRLHPIRKAIAHSRPLGRADVLTLISESNRIFGWLRIGVLH